MTALEIRIVLYALLSFGIIGTTAYATHKLDDARYESLEAQYAKYQSQVQADAVTSQKAATDALQAQIDARISAEANNAKVIQTLQSKADGARSDADLANRLLNSAIETGAAAAGDKMPKAAGGSIASAAGGTQERAGLETSVAGAIGECERNANRLDALIAEIRPQL